MIELITLANLSLVSLLWTIPLKGITMWFSVKRDQKIWFIFFLVINTMGIVELVYLLMYGLPSEFKTKSQKSKVKKKQKSKPKTKSGKKK